MYQQPPSHISQPPYQPPSLPSAPNYIVRIGCLIVPLCIAFLIASDILLSHFQDQHAPFLFQNQIVADTFQIAFYASIGGIFEFAFAAIKAWCRPINKLARGWAVLITSVWIFTLLACPLLCFVSLDLRSNIGMTRTGFLLTSASTHSRSQGTVHFYNPADGITQILCVGMDQHCQPHPGDPPQLDRGLVVQPGQVVNVEFDGGTYQITSKTTPSMNITIHNYSVNDPSW